jgi:NTE family protein
MAGKTALVLSAGGMFGAYQAGAWSVLGKHFQPDIVVGTSVGALNAWAIAGGCSGEDLVRSWTDPVAAAFLEFRVPLPPWRGFFEPEAFRTRVDNLFSRYTPRVPVGIVVTDLFRLRSRLVQTNEITARHLAAACAVPGGFPPVRVNDVWCADGGLLGALPLWGAVEMGATRTIAINALPLLPSRVLRGLAQTVRWLSREKKSAGGIDVSVLAPERPLGTISESTRWNRETLQRWIEAGADDAQRAISSGVLQDISAPAKRVLQ